MMTENDIRLTFFIGIFFSVMLLEFVFAKRILTTPKSKRWFNNLGLVALDVVLVRLLIPTTAVGAALWADEQQIGLFNSITLAPAFSVIIAVICLDLVVYWQHRIFHRVPLLWRLHQVHHADRDIDLTTGLRFHPIEILISMAVKFAVILILGAPAMAVIIFEIILNGMAMFNHGNIKLPKILDGWLRLLFVTPDMHRVHHSVLKHETNSNYGFNISFWDKLFGSYHAQPDQGHQGMTIGLNQYQSQPTHSILWMLTLPFTHKGGQYSQPDDLKAKEKNHE